MLHQRTSVERKMAQNYFHLICSYHTLYMTVANGQVVAATSSIRIDVGDDMSQVIG
jgi:hypothetical protein